MEIRQVIPALFAFRFEWPVPRLDPWKKDSANWVPIDSQHRLQRVKLGTGTAGNSLEIYLGWNAEGLGVRCLAGNLPDRPVSNPLQASSTDGLQIWIDTRNTQNIHRASRFCHHFCCLPTTTKGAQKGVVIQQPIARAKDEQALANPDEIPCRSRVDAQGYDLEVWLPAGKLEGFDPIGSPRLSFYYRWIHHGIPDQFLTVGLEFPVDADPSLWQTIVLS